MVVVASQLFNSNYRGFSPQHSEGRQQLSQLGPLENESGCCLMCVEKLLSVIPWVKSSYVALESCFVCFVRFIGDMFHSIGH